MLFFNNCVKSRISRHFVPKIPHSTKKNRHHITSPCSFRQKNRHTRIVGEAV